MSTPPPLLLLLLLLILFLSLLGSALSSPSPPVGSPPCPGNASRQPRRHRGFGIHASSGIHVAAAVHANPSIQPNDIIQANDSTLNQTGPTPMPLKRTNLFLDAHNAVRTSVAEPPLTWDHNLARYAKNWANGRVSDCKMIHSGGPYGENIFWGSRDKWTAAQIVNMWVDEVQNYDPLHNSCRDGEICGHYTQVVWRDSSKVGCARVTCSNGGMYAICVYDPPGNFIGENPFIHNVW